MKRGTGLSQRRKVLVRTAVERRKASASAKSGARRDQAQPRRRSACALRGLDYAPFGAPPPLLGGPFREIVNKPRRREQKAQRENDETRHCEPTDPREVARSDDGLREAIQGGLREREGRSGLLRRFAPRNDNPGRERD